MRKKVLVIGMGTSVFGLEKQTVEVFKFIKNVEPYFLISKYEDGSVSNLLKVNNIKFEHVSTGYIGRYNLIWTLITVVQIPILYIKLVSTYFKNGCNSILILNTHPIINATFVFLFLKYFFNAKIFFYFHNIPTNLKAFNKLFYYIIEKISYKIITVSSFVKNKLIDVGIDKNKIVAVYNGINLNKFVKIDTKRINSKFVIGYVGQFYKEKGIFDFVDAANLLLSKDEKFMFLMFGKKNADYNSLMDYISQSNISKHFQFEGWIDEIETIYSSLDILVFPSIIEEGFGLVNIEAMACKIPVIAANSGAIKEIVVDGETGYLVEKNNPQQIADCILKIVADKDLSQQMGKSARSRVEEHFDIEKNSRKIEEILLN
ncbi:MAG: glycosyltransferase family 4 protein [Thermodesulfobacteriota bacterium]